MSKKILAVMLTTNIIIAGLSKIYARDEELNYKCRTLFNKYQIDPVTKSYKGWMRVCGNGKIHLYSKQKYIEEKDVKELCGCFKDNYKTRDVEVIKDMK